jgi:phosphatidylserine/phosphatidylglycerophosphate/cardiolipin synthase-like enzyme
LLKAKQAEGVTVQILGRGELDGLVSHGKLILVDQSTAVIGSISLSPASLDSRREVAVKVLDPAAVGKLNSFFEAHL